MIMTFIIRISRVQVLPSRRAAGKCYNARKDVMCDRRTVNGKIILRISHVIKPLEQRLHYGWDRKPRSLIISTREIEIGGLQVERRW